MRIVSERKKEDVFIAWFSCGVTSAVATKFAIDWFDNVEVFYIDTGGEHPDNKRFLRDCQEWLGRKIHVRKSQDYANPMEVYSKTRFLNGPSGARCTLELKKKVRWEIEDELVVWKGQVFGFDISEEKRFKRFREQNPKTKALAPLISMNLNKASCLALLQREGIEIPAMYKLGFHNNNCIGCVKGGKGYWCAIRKHFPDVFNSMAKIEREIGHSCIKDCYLDELGEYNLSPIVPSCSIFCDPDFMDVP